jgi:ABC-type dipeptide/oligopeptide/nickel transport system permease subunit
MADAPTTLNATPGVAVAQGSPLVARPATGRAGRSRGAGRRLAPVPLAAIVVLLAVVVVAVFADRLAPYDPFAGDYGVVRQPPSAAHLFGTDDLGRDVLSRVMYGARISITVGLGAGLLGDVLGLTWGVTSGYVGRRFDLISQRMLEVLLAFPSLILATMLMIVFGAGLHTVIVAIAITRTPASTRVIRSLALSVKQMMYVDAARVAGASPLRIMFSHITPACIPAFLVVVSAHLGIAITTEAALSFVGVGVPPPAPSWGTMLAGSAIGKFSPLWWQAIFPGLAITLTVLSANLTGDALRDILDPQLRRRLD